MNRKEKILTIAMWVTVAFASLPLLREGRAARPHAAGGRNADCGRAGEKAQRKLLPKSPYSTRRTFSPSAQRRSMW